jgi:uncharacterized protein YutE (UPF0331/DUF86 family)
MIDGTLAGSLKKMTGFRILAVHRYDDLDMAVVEKLIRPGRDDLLRFSGETLRLPPPPSAP